MTDRPQRHPLGDPRIAWTVVLTARVGRGLEPSVAAARLEALAERSGWTSPYPLEVTTEGNEITLAADHRDLDGQAMLTALGSVLDTSARSLARGVDDERRQVALGRAGLRRLADMVTRPSAVVPSTHLSDTAADDATARLEIPSPVSTSDLVVAAARVIEARTSRPVSVAIGVAKQAEGDVRLADRSGYLRIRDARGLTRPEVSDVLRHAPLQPGAGAAGGAFGALAGLVTRVLADRLGSTILISHLGEVVAVGVTDLAFYPVSGGASGLSLGAATLDGRTTLTLRARGGRHDRDGLERLLETIAAALS